MKDLLRCSQEQNSALPFRFWWFALAVGVSVTAPLAAIVKHCLLHLSRWPRSFAVRIRPCHQIHEETTVNVTVSRLPRFRLSCAPGLVAAHKADTPASSRAAVHARMMRLVRLIKFLWHLMDCILGNEFLIAPTMMYRTACARRLNLAVTMVIGALFLYSVNCTAKAAKWKLRSPIGSSYMAHPKDKRTRGRNLREGKIGEHCKGRHYSKVTLPALITSIPSFSL